LSLEFKLRDKEGNPLKDQQGNDVVISIPDERSNRSVRHRQELLARWTGDDIPVASPVSESIAAPGHQIPEVSYWEMTQAGQLTLLSQPQHLVPRDRPVLGPSPMSLALVRSYVRHLCRVHGAAKADVFRRHQEPIPAMMLFTNENVPANTFDPIISYFGEFSE